MASVDAMPYERKEMNRGARALLTLLVGRSGREEAQVAVGGLLLLGCPLVCCSCFLFNFLQAENKEKITGEKKTCMRNIKISS